MSDVALAPAPVEPKADRAPVRRFQLPDINSEAEWLMPRLLAVYKHLNSTALYGWLRGNIYSNEYLFLFQQNSVALAQVMSAHTLQPRPVVQEHFVWARDPRNKDHVEEAAEFYTEMLRWAERQNADVMIVGELTDVPIETIKTKVNGRIFTREQRFARVK